MRRFGLPVAFRTVVGMLADVARLGFLTLHSRAELAAENLFLRKQLALYLARQVRPRRADDTTRIALVALSRLVDWRQLLAIVKGHADSLASNGVPLVLAVAIKRTGPSRHSGKCAAADCADGDGESDLVRGADRRGTRRQAWDSGVAANGSPICAA